VAIERVFIDSDGTQTAAFEWYLHAVSTRNGDPLFPFHRRLENPLMGLQYDYAHSRIVGHTVPYWTSKAPSADWRPEVQIFQINTLDLQDVRFNFSSIPFSLEDTSAQSVLMSTGVTTMDVINRIYYITAPNIPMATIESIDPETPDIDYADYARYTTVVCGINLDAEGAQRVIICRDMQENVVLLEANSRYHDLSAVLLDSGRGETMTTSAEGRFFHTTLGESFRPNASMFLRDAFVENLDFTWNASGEDEFQVNESYIQVGATANDPYTDASWFVVKNDTSKGSQLAVAGINLPKAETHAVVNLGPMATPDVQSAWLLNNEPILPWMPARGPKNTRFVMSGEAVIVQFEPYTFAKLIQVDLDGDSLPDIADWSELQTGVRNCSDMFAEGTETILWPPRSQCEWVDWGIHIRFPGWVDTLRLGDLLTFRNETIQQHWNFTGEWTLPLFGNTVVDIPDPLYPPVPVGSITSFNYGGAVSNLEGDVDLCESATIDASASWRHGGIPFFRWSVRIIHCESIGGYVFEPDQPLLNALRERLDYFGTLPGVFL
jgi:hypothetical protein